MRKIKFIAILLVLSMLLTVPAFAFSTSFTDVSEKATYAESVSYLADAGILRGTASGGFAPNEKITVSQWATMLCFVAGSGHECRSDRHPQRLAGADCTQ